MKFSYRWISELTGGIALAPTELEGLITVKTAECEGIEPFAPHLSSVVIAQVLSTEPVGKGKNKRVTINVGRRVEVVCGAPNVRPGLLTAWIPPGTDLDGTAIGMAAIDGVESEGMLASGSELGINRDHSGVLELQTGVPGAAICATNPSEKWGQSPSAEGLSPFSGPPPANLWGLSPDWIIEIDNKSLTHRPDLWGHIGMAREVAAISGCKLLDPVNLNLLPSGPSSFEIEISDYTLCPRYSALLFENVTVASSPLGMQARLQSVGLNPISNFVDVTNFVLAELPQPMHAFDADKLSGNTISIRPSRTGERLRALNGETYELVPADLVIADASGPIALAGVIGGADTAISASTKRVLFESANFAPSGVRLTSSRHKIRTDASMRFEKSLDPENTLRGLARAMSLIPTPPTGGVLDVRGPIRPSQPILLPVQFVSRKLGNPMTEQGISDILQSLGFGISEASEGVLSVDVPSWRATKDISIKDDLVEEVGRIIGYDQITPQPPAVASVVPASNPERVYQRQLRSQIAAQGFTEIYNYSFISTAEAARFSFDPAKLLAVANPIAAEMTHLRPSLLPGMWKNIVDNVRHFQEFRIFELGNQLPEGIPHLAAALYSAHGDESDLFELKRVLECLLRGVILHAAKSRSYEHPARAAEVHWHGQAVGRFFEIHPSLLEQEGIEGRAMIFDIDLQQTQTIAIAHVPKYVQPRKYPTSGLDLSVLTSRETPVATIQSALIEFGGFDLAMTEFVRQYVGLPLPPGQKSVTYHLEIGSLERTLTTEEVTDVRNRIIEGMRSRGFDFRA